MGRFFNSMDVVPVITRIVTNRTSPGGAYLSRESIVQVLLQDPSDRVLIQQCHRRYKREGGTESLQRFAGNMVDWFSAWWKRGYFGLRNAFDRERIDGTWAYRVAMPKSTLDLDDLNRITIEATLNIPPTLTSPAALAMRETLQQQVDDIKAKGWMVDLVKD